jgi:hypothetical protein
MKKTMIFAALTVFGMMAHAESVKVKVTGSTSPLPAGEYTVSTVPGSTAVLLVESAGKKMFAFGRLVRGVDGKTTVELSGLKPKPTLLAGLTK